MVTKTIAYIVSLTLQQPLILCKRVAPIGGETPISQYERPSSTSDWEYENREQRHKNNRTDELIKGY